MELKQTPWIDGFLADIQNENTEVSVTIKGHVLRFKVVSDSAELAKIKAKAGMLADATAKKVPGPWADYTPMDRSTAGRVALLAEISIEPKLSELDCMKIAKQNALFFDTVMEALDQATRIEVDVAHVKRVEAAKNESGETPASETD